MLKKTGPVNLQRQFVSGDNVPCSPSFSASWASALMAVEGMLEHQNQLKARTTSDIDSTRGESFAMISYMIPLMTIVAIIVLVLKAHQL